MNVPLTCAALVLIATAGCERSTSAAAPTECRAAPTAVDSATRAQLVVARDAVWRAWFAGDSAALVRLLPEPMVGMGQDRAAIIADAQGSARAGRRLEKLEFTCDELYVSGDVALVFSNYRTDVRDGKDLEVTTGRAIELFERRNGVWVNPSWHLDEDAARDD